MKRQTEKDIVVEYGNLSTVTTMENLLGLIEEYDCVLYKEQEILGPEISIPISIHSLQ